MSNFKVGLPLGHVSLAQGRGPVTFGVAHLIRIARRPGLRLMAQTFGVFCLVLSRHRHFQVFRYCSIWSLRPRPEWNRRPGCCNGPPGRAEHGRTAGTIEHCIRPLEQSRLCLISLTRSTYRKGLVSSVPLRYIPWWQRWRRLLHEAAAPDSAQFVRVCDPGASAPDTVRHAGRHDAPRSPRHHSRAPAFGLRRGPG